MKITDEQVTAALSVDASLRTGRPAPALEGMNAVLSAALGRATPAMLTRALLAAVILAPALRGQVDADYTRRGAMRRILEAAATDPDAAPPGLEGGVRWPSLRAHLTRAGDIVEAGSEQLWLLWRSEDSPVVTVQTADGEELGTYALRLELVVAAPAGQPVKPGTAN